MVKLNSVQEAIQYLRQVGGQMRAAKIDIGGMHVGWEYQTEFPAGDGDGCSSGIVISHGVTISETLRGKGYGGLAHVARLERFRTEGYNYALCTVLRNNDSQLAILKKNGWVRLANTATQDGTPIYLFGKSLR